VSSSSRAFIWAWVSSSLLLFSSSSLIFLSFSSCFLEGIDEKDNGDVDVGKFQDVDNGDDFDVVGDGDSVDDEDFDDDFADGANNVEDIGDVDFDTAAGAEYSERGE